MKQPRTVMFALAAQGEHLLLLKSALCAVANLLCLSDQIGPLPRLGICALVLAAKTGKVQLKVRTPCRLLLKFDFLSEEHLALLKKFPTLTLPFTLTSYHSAG